MMNKRIYLDTAATTRVDPEVIREMQPYFSERFGNSSSIHALGREADQALQRSRRTISKKANGRNHKLVFTSGGTESNNFAIKGVGFANRDKGKHMITTKVEHDCVLNASRWMEKQGFEVTYLGVDREGFIDLGELEGAIRKDTILASILHANNEIGTLQDLKEIGRICSSKGVLFHTDACQSFTKTDINLDKQNIDLLTINGHKIYGPKGVGGLFVRQGIKIDPLMHGGGHEFGLRSSTVNIPGIVGFAKAVEIMKDKHIDHMSKLRDVLIEKASGFEESWLNGPRKNRLCNNTNFSFRHIEGESLVVHLDLKGIEASTGSACSSKSLEPSHVLTAIGLKPEEAHGSIRLSLGKENTREEVDYALEILEESVVTLRKISPFKSR
jgi:cysteine desulfurase